MGVRGTLGRLDEMVDAKSEPPDPDQVEDHVQDCSNTHNECANFKL